jgi:DNA-binding transcriptional LysR family regulator
LTARGTALARRLRLAQSELDAAIAELGQLHGREVGRIVIGAMPLSRAKLLPDTVGRFHRLYPSVDVTIIEGSHTELIGPLRDGEIDLMIGALRGNVPADLVQRPMFVDRPVVLGRAEHPLRNMSRVPSAAELAAFPWVVPALPTPLRLQWARMFEGSGIKPPRVAIECGSVLVIRQLLLESDHLTLLSPAQVAVELEAGWLVKLCPAPGNPTRTIGMTCRTEWRPTRLQQRFIDVLEEQAGLIQTGDA